MPIEKLRKFLDDQKVKYVTIKHSPAFTAQRVAASAHISGNDLAKTVIIKVDAKMAMAVLPASYQVDFDQLRQLIAADNVELATEEEFGDLFPECEIGAMPPFGNLYGMQVYVAEKLAEDEEIAFSAGSHSELIQLAYDDFYRLTKPIVLHFSGQFA